MIKKVYQQIKPELDLSVSFQLHICRKTNCVTVENIVNNETNDEVLKGFLLKQNKSYVYHQDGNKIYIKVEGRYFQFEEVKSYAGLDGDLQGDGVIQSKMPGKILDVLVAKDDLVKKGDALVIMESMKMENTISSPIDGVVTNVYVGSNELVDADQILIEISFLE
ncbi:MAG: acetyl-CoA carboxylase biotin carboxyl carrier protein subunit [Candidatus Cloacimonetes bacterium]|nr:acetyl-CoA carboxylase biotin carboxyl carrier protein subunit [Candidatus Cloacimonadota bacterium]